MATNRVAYLKGNRRVPEPRIFVQTSVYLDNWSGRKPKVDSFIYIQEQGSERNALTLTRSEAEALMASINSALTDLVLEEDKLMSRMANGIDEEVE